MKKNIMYGSIFLFVTIVGLTIFFFFYQSTFVKFEEEKIKVVLDNENWSNDSVNVTVEYDGDIKPKKYSFDGGKTWQNENKYVAKKNEKLVIILKDSYGKQSEPIEYRINNIDKELPTIEVDATIYTAINAEFNFDEYYLVNDKESGIKDVIVTGKEDIDVSTLGSYEVTIEVTDYAGNYNATSVMVSVVEKNDPNLLLNQKKEVPVTGITVDKTNVSLVKGTKIKIVPTIKPSNATNKKIKWESVNQNVAKVSSDGVITAVGSGSTTITATTLDGEKKSEINVVVSNVAIEVQSITLDRKNDTLTTDHGKFTLVATIKPETATNQEIKWNSSNLSVASIAGGEVTIHNEGETTITAATSNGKLATYHLIVKDTYIFQERENIRRGEIESYFITIYKNGRDITEQVTLISDPIQVSKDRRGRFEITLKQHDTLKETLTIMYNSDKHEVKRG